MKFRIFGTLVVLAILCAIYVAQDENKQQPAPIVDTQSADPDANVLKGLKIN